MRAGSSAGGACFLSCRPALATLQARYALLAAELQLQQRSLRRPATAVPSGAARRASPDYRPATAAARWRPPSRVGSGYGAQPADVAEAVVSVVANTSHAGGASGQAARTALAEQSGAAAGAAPTQPAEAALEISLPMAAAEEEGGSSSSASGVQPAEEEAAGEPRYSGQWEAEEADAEGQPCAAAPSKCCHLIDVQNGDGSSVCAQQAPAADAVPAPASVGDSAAEQQAAAAPPVESSPQVQPCMECPEPAVTTAAAAPQVLEASGPAAVSCPVVQRLGSRGSSFAGEPPSPEAGIAVPVAGGGLGTAVGAELLAACSMRATLAADSWNTMPASAVSTAAPGEERRDTPPQHIAARHQQVAAAARREVQAALAKRGLRLDGL